MGPASDIALTPGECSEKGGGINNTGVRLHRALLMDGGVFASLLYVTKVDPARVTI